jgi:hypothetical protein
VLESALTGAMPKLASDEGVVQVHEEEAVWGGNVIGHYGHFLTESVARLWPVLPGAELEGRPVVFTTPREQLFVRDWLRAFGVRTVDLPERGLVRFTRMYVPQPALRHGAWIAPEIREIHLHARRGLDLPPSPPRDVLWLSRSKLERDHVAYDEVLLEWLLGTHVSIVNPETMTLAAQVAAFEGARAVAGVVGSAFHTLLLAAKPPDCLYLCPPWERPAYPAQHRYLDSKATFVQALAVAARRRRARDGIAFPGAYRVLVPESLRALSETVLPELLEDSRLAAFADLQGRAQQDGGDFEGDLDGAVARVLTEPLAIEPRVNLATMLEAEGLTHCADEQRLVIADLSEEQAPERG